MVPKAAKLRILLGEYCFELPSPTIPPPLGWGKLNSTLFGRKRQRQLQEPLYSDESTESCPAPPGLTAQRQSMAASMNNHPNGPVFDFNSGPGNGPSRSPQQQGSRPPATVNLSTSLFTSPGSGGQQPRGGTPTSNSPCDNCGSSAAARGVAICDVGDGHTMC